MNGLKEKCHRMAWVRLCVLLLCVQTVPLQSALQGQDALKLWYTQPAAEWTDALPIGNGRLGAMVYGGSEQKRLQLNEDTLWTGGPRSYYNPDAYLHLATVRELLLQGEYAKAEATAQRMLGSPIRQMAHQPLGDLFLDFAQKEQPSEYYRELNLEDAVTRVTYRVGDARFTRKAFASHPDQCIVLRLECDKGGQLTFDLSMTSPHLFRSHAIRGDTLSMTGQVTPRKDQRLSGARGLIGPWQGEGMKFAAQVKVAAEGGTVTAQGDKVSVRDADAVTLCYSAATNYVSYQDTSGSPLDKVRAYLADIQGKTFDQSTSDTLMTIRNYSTV